MNDLHGALKAAPQERRTRSRGELQRPFAHVVNELEHPVTERRLKFEAQHFLPELYRSETRAPLEAANSEPPRRSDVVTLPSRSRTMKPRGLLLLVPVALALSACAVAPGVPAYGYGYGYGYDPGPTWIEPAPYYYQPLPPSPYVGGVWIGGSWTDVHGRREWHPGHWAPPSSGDVRAHPPHRGDGRYAGDQGHRPPRTGDRGDGRRGGSWGFAGSQERGATRQVPQYPGAVFDAGSRTDPRITPP